MVDKIMEMIEKYGAAMAIFVIILGLTFWALVIWAAIHFIDKWW